MPLVTTRNGEISEPFQYIIFAFSLVICEPVSFAEGKLKEISVKEVKVNQTFNFVSRKGGHTFLLSTNRNSYIEIQWDHHV